MSLANPGNKKKTMCTFQQGWGTNDRKQRQLMFHKSKHTLSCVVASKSCIYSNWRDVQRKNVVNNVDMSSLRAPWQNEILNYQDFILFSH